MLPLDGTIFSFHLWLGFFFLILVQSQQTTGWQEDLRPLHYIQLEENEVLRFRGNQSHKDHFKLLERDKDSLLIGARNIVYNISLKDLQENGDQRLEWHSTKDDRNTCIMKGKSEDDCQNYIRVLAKTEDHRLLICGTNSYKPRCRHYKYENGAYVVETEKTGIGVCPYDPSHNSTAVYVDGELYTATVADFSGSDPIIYRANLRTEQSDLKHLNAPNFVSSIKDSDYVFFFFRETAVEYINCGKTVYSRVARVCKHDKGGPQRFKNLWTSFLKSRLNCSVPGDFPFYFDEIQSTSDIVTGKYDGQNMKLIYGVFTTSPNSLSGSAVCAFKIQDILDTFEGSFKDQETINSNWLPIHMKEVPEPRPGQCVNDSRTLPDVTLNFVRLHSLMDEAVPSFFGSPLVIRTSLQYRFTKIAVDPQVKTPDGKAYDVLFIGTDNGKVIKAINSDSWDTNKRVSPVIIEEIDVFSNHDAITNLYVVRTSENPEDAKLIVVSDNEIQAVKLQRCYTEKIISCSECVALQDPYCAWDKSRQRCVSVGSPRWSAGVGFIQDVAHGEHSDPACPRVPKLGASREKPPIYSTETLAIAVTTSCVAALVVGFILGFLFSRRCRSEDYGSPYDASYLEQRHRLNRTSVMNHTDPNSLPPNNKSINLVLNVPQKNGNGKNANSSADNKPLQKVKKIYL